MKPSSTSSSSLSLVSTKESKSEPPFPWLAMGSICLGMLAHSCIFTTPMPFVAFMAVDFGMSPSLDTAGYWAGWITGTFMIGRSIVGIPWGLASDKWGRKPCLLLSMFNVTVFGILFGFSTNFTMAVLSRLAIGLGNGFMGIAKVCVTEIAQCKEHELRGFGMINGIWGLGLIIGPAIGGILSRPAIQYPHLFSANSIWGQFPYLLPCLVCASMSVIAFFTVYFYIDETLTTLTEKTEVSSVTSTSLYSLTQSNRSIKSRSIDKSNNSSNSKVKSWIGRMKSLLKGRRRNEGNYYDELSNSSSHGMTDMDNHDSNYHDNNSNSNSSNRNSNSNGYTSIFNLEEESEDDNENDNDMDENNRNYISKIMEEWKAIPNIDYDYESTDSSHEMKDEFHQDSGIELNKLHEISYDKISKELEIEEEDDDVSSIGFLDESDLERLHSYHIEKTKDIESHGIDILSNTLTEHDKITKPNTFQAIIDDSSIRFLFKVYMSFCFIITFVDEATPLWAVTSLSEGGLAFTSAETGAMLASVGLGLVIFQIFLYEPLIIRYFNNGPTNTIFRLAVIASMGLAFVPVFSTISISLTEEYRNNLTSSTRKVIVHLSVLIMQLFYRCSGTSAFSTLAVIVNGSVAKEMRGTINGIIMTAGSLGNALGPIVGSALYAALIDAPAPLDGRYIFVIAAILMMAYGFTCRKYLIVPDK